MPLLSWLPRWFLAGGALCLLPWWANLMASTAGRSPVRTRGGRLISRVSPADGRFVDFGVFSGTQAQTFGARGLGCSPYRLSSSMRWIGARALTRSSSSSSIAGLIVSRQRQSFSSVFSRM